MTSVLSKTDIPCDRVDVLHILALNDDNLRNLSYEQKKKIRELYFLDLDLSIEQRVRVGSFLTDHMEDATIAINQYQRGGP